MDNTTTSSHLFLNKRGLKASKNKNLQQKRSSITPSKQRGVTLMELLVGITIGLLTIGVALGALMTSRTVTGTVSDASQLQQQAAYAFRIMGQQLRQAGSIRLNLASSKAEDAPIEAADPVAFELGITGNSVVDSFDPRKDTLQGLDDPSDSDFKLMTGFRNYLEPLFSSGGNGSQLRDCLGQSANNALMQSRFTTRERDDILELVCASATGAPQPIIQNVADFDVRYIFQNSAAGNPQIQWVDAATASANWGAVTGVEICLVLHGSERMDLPTDGSSVYTDCAGNTHDITDSQAVPQPRHQRLHMTFRNIFQIRSQGLAG